MDYLEIHIQCGESYRDLIIAELDVAGFESFWETDEGVNAYITKEEFDEELLQAVLQKYRSMTDITFTVNDFKEKNWNEEWEKNYDPIVVEEKIFVGASFHQVQKERYPYFIEINPRMSFGTGHHETTYLMLAHQLEINHKEKKVLDLGCGTGILAIMAAKLGATHIAAVDNNEWAIDNCRDNFEINQCDVQIVHGTIDDVPLQSFDIILANINRNVLLEEVNQYFDYLCNDGTLLLSGFYNHDAHLLEQKVTGYGWTSVLRKEKNDWVAIKFNKL